MKTSILITISEKDVRPDLIPSYLIQSYKLLEDLAHHIKKFDRDIKFEVKIEDPEMNTKANGLHSLARRMQMGDK